MDGEQILNARQFVWLDEYRRAMNQAEGRIVANGSQELPTVVAKSYADAALKAFDAAFPDAPFDAAEFDRMRRELNAIKKQCDQYDEFDRVFDPECILPDLADRVHHIIGDCVSSTVAATPTEATDKKTADGHVVFIGQELAYAEWDIALNCPMVSHGEVRQGEHGPVVVMKDGTKIDPALCSVDPLKAASRAYESQRGPSQQTADGVPVEFGMDLFAPLDTGNYATVTPCKAVLLKGDWAVRYEPDSIPPNAGAVCIDKCYRDSTAAFQKALEIAASNRERAASNA